MPLPGSNSRGRGNKFKKYTRGGSRHFSSESRVLDDNGNEISMWSTEAQQKLARDVQEESEDEGGSDLEVDRDDEPPSSAPITDQSRLDRKEAKKVRKAAAIARRQGNVVEVGDMPPSDSEDEDVADGPVNLNLTSTTRGQTSRALDGLTGEIEKVIIKDKGKESAKREEDASRKADLERLAEIRKQREQAEEIKKANAAESQENAARRRLEFEAKRDAASKRRGRSK